VEAEKFAREIAKTLDEALLARAYDRVVLVAAPAFLGLLREILPDRVQRHVADVVEKDYLHLDSREVHERLQHQLEAR